MKKLIVFLFLINSLGAFSQNTKTTQIVDENKEINTHDSTSALSSILLGYPEFYINSDLKDLKLHIPKQNNYLAIYNQTTLSYDYYPFNAKVSFDLNAVNFNQSGYNLSIKDSFNPYGVLNPQSSVFIGVINTFLNKIQD